MMTMILSIGVMLILSYVRTLANAYVRAFRVRVRNLSLSNPLPDLIFAPRSVRLASIRLDCSTTLIQIFNSDDTIERSKYTSLLYRIGIFFL